jgi:hypothetical protein
MMATSFSKAQCKTVMRPFLNAGLSASGIARYMPRAVVWGPLRYQGLVIRHLYTTQGVEHLLALLRHGTCPTLTGQLLWTSLEELQLEIGLPCSFLSYKYSTFRILATHSWLAATWQFLSESDSTVHNPIHKPAPACDNDCFLMVCFAAHGYSGSNLRDLNICRMHLHALRLSDLCTADGRKFTDSFMEIQQDLTCLSPYSWSRPHRPAPRIHSKWRTALTRLFLHTTVLQQLVDPLGAFTISVSQSWTWRYSPSEQRHFTSNDTYRAFYHVC